MPRRYPKLLEYLICDDIRQETGNKTSYMGVFKTSTMTLPIPAVLPKLCFHLAFSKVRSGDKVEFHLLDPNQKELGQFGPIDVEAPKGTKMRVCMLDLSLGAIPIKKEGVYKLIIAFGEDEKAKHEITLTINKQK